MLDSYQARVRRLATLKQYVSILTFYPMSILRKMAIFIEKPPVTSSNCYETMKNASMLMKLGTNVD
jgi:hypothetical protein